MATLTKPVELSTVEVRALQKPRSLWSDAWQQFRKHNLAIIGSVTMIIIVFFVLIGPLIWTVDPQDIDITAAYSGPTAEHPLGADNLGRDNLARVMFGGRVSLSIGVAAMLVAMIIGSLVGLVSGYFNRLDDPLMRITDLFLSLPLLPLLLVITMLFRDNLRMAFGPEAGIFILIVVVIGVLGWMATARLVRGEVLSMKERDFIIAARGLGARDSSILRVHILPNVLSPVLVSATFAIATAIITESALSFLGLGFPPDFPTWGRLLYDGKDYLSLTPTMVIWPGLMISLTVLSVNFIGDGLRDALDPRVRKS